MKVLLLTHIYPTPVRPTRGTFNGNIFQALSRQCETRLIVPEPWWARVRRPAELANVPHDQFTGIDTLYPTYWSVPRLPAAHGEGLYRSLRPLVTRLRREFPFDAILAAWAYPDGYAAARLAQDFGVPLVTKILGSDINEMPRHPALRKRIQWGLQHSQRVVTVSHALREKVIELGIPEERVVVQHNGVDGEKFTLRDRAEVRAALGLPQDRPIINFVGRLSHEKGLDVLIQAMDHLRRAGRSDVLLTLVGGGPLEQTLRTQVQTLGLEDQVQFCGNQLHTDIPRWISAGDVFCLPSRREGCPNVVLEALASGRPVVASNVGGLPELISGENGILVTSEDALMLARGLERAVQRSWSPQALRASVQFLSWDAVGRAYNTVLEAAGPMAHLSKLSMFPPAVAGRPGV